MDFITIDFETATSQRNSACEIGLTFVKNNQIINTKSWLIKPIQYPDFDWFNISIHGIRPNQVTNKPEFNELWVELLPLIENQLLIAHNASFDISVLRKTLEVYQIPFPNLQYSCSYIFSKKVWEGLPSYGLEYLCKHNNIKFEHHRAGPDSKATAELCLKAFEIIGINSIEDFPEKLKTSIGKLFDGGYKAAEAKDTKEIIGDPSRYKYDSIFFGKTVIFTGTLSSMKRDDAKQIIANIGGVIGKDVSKKTDFLIVGQQDYRIVGDDGMSTKQEKAIKLVEDGSKLEILSEDEFLRNI